ncbi:RraA family protein [Streptomyces sp. JJ36]|uniref:RraA family protein n=1 Tax=Streptomyces sp. JJ36 TaxID=2736645 RepID=UPI001F2F9CF1|nr:RraA family protein [Streptomyces sp. JJ36]MCF6523146.1 RraA family protein [Streptomyces sp. JJ36]
MTPTPPTGPEAASEQRAAAVRSLRCADLVDALGRLHRHHAHILDLVTPTPGRVLFGPAATISYFPSCSAMMDPEHYNFGALFRQAVGPDADAARGKVLVLASNGYRDAPVGGGTKLARVAHHDLAGVLTDARLRDFDELRSYPFAAYCSGAAVRWGGDVITPALANVPVVVAGVGVLPGQYVFADDSGAVVIPESDVDAVLAGATAVREEDAGFRAQIAEERRTGQAGTGARHER